MKSLLVLSAFLACVYCLVDSETVRVNLLSPRSDTTARRVEITAFGKTQYLRLVPAPLPVSSNFVVRSVSSNPDGTQFHSDYKPNLVELAKKFYQDTEAGASVMLEDTPDGLHIEGILNEDLMIVPSKNRFMEDGTPAHAVTKIPKNKNVVPMKVYAPAINFTRTDSARADDCVTVEALSISDYLHQKSFTSDDEVTKYHVIFNNAMNIRYAALTSPRVALITAAVIRNKDTNVQPYIEKHLINNGEYLNADALGDFRDYYNQNQKDLKYDVAMLLTGHDLVGDDGSGSLNPGVAGVCYMRAMCGNSRYCFAEDSAGSWSGIILQTHELGHCLGSDHDGEGEGSACSSDQRFIMATDGGENHKFSPCSKKQFTKYIATAEFDCLRRMDNGNSHKEDLLPGQMVSRDARCKIMHPTEDGIYSYRPNNAAPCKMYCAIKTGGGIQYWTHDDLDGQECGTNKYCWMAQCHDKQVLPWGC